MDEIAKEFEKNNVHITTQLIAQEGQKKAEKIIVQYGKENDIEVILVGSRGMGNIKSMVLGSVSKHVLQHANCHVFVMKK